MESFSEKVTRDSWINIADNEDYIMQCKSDNTLLVKVGAEPTDVAGALELVRGDILTSTILSGKIWVKALSDDVLIAYAK